jgi:ABC-type multidrug transport system fused ATPase/permease subunit
MGRGKNIASFLFVLIRFDRRQFAINSLLTILGAAGSGISLLMFIPLLHLSGWLPGEESPRWVALKSGLGLSGPLPLFAALGIFLLIIALTATLEYLQRQQSARLRFAFLAKLQNNLNAAVARARWSYLLTQKLHDASHLMTVGINDVSTLTYLFLQMLGESFFVIISVGVSLWLSPGLTLIAIGTALASFYLVRKHRAFQIGQNQFLASRRSYGETTKFMEGVKIAKSYNQIEPYLRHFERVNEEAISWQLQFFTRDAKTRLTLRLISALSFTFVFCVAVLYFKTPVAILITLLALFSRLMPRMSGLYQSLIRVLALLPGYQAMEAMMSGFNDYREAAAVDTTPMAFTSGIRFCDVHYRYGDKRALTGLTCTLNSHTTTAIVGESGSGKTTFADLLMGLLTPESGHIEIDGIPLTADRAEAWRAQIAYVPQEPFLFNDSVAANLRWASPETSAKDLWRALALAGADTIVQGLPQKLETKIGDRGMNLSGGERQRLALARALLRDPKLIILDEATNALDPKSEARFQSALKQLHNTVTLVVIAHRYQTIESADQVIVLNQGRLVETGSPKSLSGCPNSRFAQLFAESLPPA